MGLHLAYVRNLGNEMRCNQLQQIETLTVQNEESIEILVRGIRESIIAEADYV